MLQSFFDSFMGIIPNKLLHLLLTALTGKESVLLISVEELTETETWLLPTFFTCLRK